jgi:pimeloyl-ACP methyl ester carboxylesterase
MRDNAVERLFSLFTSSDRAEAIAGDLAEEREQHGWVWYWLHVARTTLALWRSTVTEAPLRVLALMLAGCALLTAPAFAGAAAVYLVPQLFGSAVSWISLSFFWWGGALWAGASLVAIAPRRGMAACATLAVVGAALLLAFGVTIESQEFSRVDRMFFTMALGTAVALLAGGAIARRRTIVIAVPFAVTIGLAATVLFVMPAASSSAQQNEWRDPSPHVVKSVPVDTDVQLEVLDWGGSGPALVLLAGGGATAHQYDDFAPALTARYRVVGVTRRGHRGSSAASGGYGVARLAEDVLRVMDAVGVTNPVVIGHSFAGEEMHVLGARHPAKISGLVYVDAAFDRGDDADDEAYNAAARPVPAAPSAKPDDLASFAALRAYLEKYGGAGPEGYLRTRYRANPDGSVGGLWTPERPIIQAMRKEMRAGWNPYNPERIRVPSLAIYAVPKSADDLMRRGSSDRLAFPELVARAADDPALRECVETLYLLTRERVRNHEKWFEAFAERGRVVELSGTHDLIVSNPREVLEQIEAFVSSLKERR